MLGNLTVQIGLQIDSNIKMRLIGNNYPLLGNALVLIVHNIVCEKGI